MPKELLPRFSYAKLVLIFWFGITISFLISPGYLIQQAFFSLFDQDARTIYEGIYEGGIGSFSNISMWLIQAFDPMFLLISYMIAVSTVLMSSSRKFFTAMWISTALPMFLLISYMIAVSTVLMSSSRNFFTAMWISTALGLSALDVFYAILAKSLTISDLLQNIIANAIGGLLLALIFPAILWVSEWLFCHARVSMMWKHFVSAFGATLIGLASSVLLYLFFQFFLHALPINARIVTTLPVRGILAAQRPSATQTSSQDDFTLIPTNAKLETLELLVHDNLEVRWNKAQADTTFSLSLYAVSGCDSSSKLDKMPHEKAIFSQENVSDVRISGDAPMRWLQIKGEQSKIVISGKPISLFWLEEGSADSSLQITQFLSDDAHVQAQTSEDVAIMMTTALLEREVERSNLVQRRFSLIVDGQEKELSFAPMARFPEDYIVECKILSNDASDSSRSSKIQFEGQIVAGTLVHIKRTDGPSGYFNDFDGQYDLYHASGHLKAPVVKLPHLFNSRAGKISGIELWESLSEIEIEGSPQTFSPSQRFRGFGDASASYLKDGRLSITGEFHAAWLGSKRLNQTHWERLHIVLKAALVPVLLAVLVWLAKLAKYSMRLWREDRRLFWENT